MKLEITTEDSVATFAGGSSVRAVGTTEFSVRICDDEIRVSDVQIWERCQFEFIMGLNVLEKYYVIDLPGGRMFRKDNVIKYQKVSRDYPKLIKVPIRNTTIGAIFTMLI